MANKRGVWLYLELVVVAIATGVGGSLENAAADARPSKPSHYAMPFNRTSFPNGFIFGAGSAAYQTEGAADIDGKGPSIWDTFAENHPEKIEDHSSGDVADDFYHRYEEDVQLMKKIGLDSFRFSISWPRVLPKGKISCGVNALGVRFYNNLINELLANGIIPFVTLFHWDLPQALEDEYGGFLSPKVVDDFKEYADFCFKTFGDRVKHWSTLNEPYTFTDSGYNGGMFAPGRCSTYVGNCTQGNSATEPYIVGHHLLLAHAKAVDQYKRKYQASQKGQIGITLNIHCILPMSVSSEADRKAAERTLDFMFGWFAHPITYGDYPENMRYFVGNRLPIFTEEESKMLKGSMDFLGVNYYTARYASNNPISTTVNSSFSTDMQSTLSAFKSGVAIGTPTPLNWIYIYPRGLYNVMLYVRDKYKNPPIYVTENGVADANNASLPIKEVLKDALRIKYHSSHLTHLLKAINEGANVKGYYPWSFWDNFEWSKGYTFRFGMIYVDYKNKLKRYLKYSAYWFKMFLLH